MKEFAAYYPGVYNYDNTASWAHPWFPKYNPQYWKEYQEIVNLYEWEGVAGQPAKKVALIDYDYLAEFDVRQADSAVAYIKQHAKDAKMMTHIDCWSTLASMVGITPPPKGEMMDNNGKPIYFDSIDNSAYILGKAEHSARKSWVYIDGESFTALRVDIGGDEKEPWIKIAWKYTWTAKDTWLGPEQNLGAIGAIYNLT